MQNEQRMLSICHQFTVRKTSPQATLKQAASAVCSPRALKPLTTTLASDDQA